MVQGIVRDSPKFDSSFDRGRTLKAKYRRAQLSLGLEEALADMKPGGVKMVFLVPELSIACPKVRIPLPSPPTPAPIPLKATRAFLEYIVCVSTLLSDDGMGSLPWKYAGKGLRCGY